jgi:enamine deaminase RidA (YjgF/YER057c/UK114 family)
MNAVYAEVFGGNKPARTTVATGMVAEGMRIEIDCVAYVPRPS